jgi:hypothetical protein
MSEEIRQNDKFFQDKAAPRGLAGLVRNRAFQVTAGAVAVCLLALTMCGGGAGTITFAEHVDDNLNTTNEGTEFSMGWVAMVIRGTRPFGDSTLTVFVRKAGTEAWAPVEQHTVSAEWDTFVTPVLLDATGDYEIKVETGTGDTVAQSAVSIR